MTAESAFRTKDSQTRHFRRWLARALPWLLLVFAVVIVVLEVQRPKALIGVGIPWARAGSLAMVMTAIVITGGIDLSVASIVALSSMVMGVVWEGGFSFYFACGAGLCAGVIAGGINGTLVISGLPPLVATLATMAFYSGGAMWLAAGESRSALPDAPVDITRIAGLPAEYWVLLLGFVIFTILIHQTRFGRWCFAIGENPIAAQFAAVPVKWTQWWLYTASGLVAAIVAIIYTAREGALPDVHKGMELDVIACVVVGGTLITGGRGGIPLTLLGLAVVATLDIGLHFLGTRVPLVDAEARLMIKGILVIAVALGNEWLARDPT